MAHLEDSTPAIETPTQAAPPQSSNSRQDREPRRGPVHRPAAFPHQHFSPDRTPSWRIYAKVIPFAIVGVALLVASIRLEMHWPNMWWVRAIDELGVVLLVVTCLHALYETVIHRMLHRDIKQLGDSVEALQRTVHIAEGAVESGLSAVYSSRDEVNRELANQMENMSDGATLKLLGISLGTFLCPHGAMHGTFRKLLSRKDIQIEALILNKDSTAAIERAKLEEPQMFEDSAADAVKEKYETTRCHNELKTATDFARVLSEHCYYRDQNQQKKQAKWAPNEPSIDARFSFSIYDIPPLCYLVIFEDTMFLESYHNAGRGGESPVLEIAKYSRGESNEPTALFKIYEHHYNRVKGLSHSGKPQN